MEKPLSINIGDKISFTYDNGLFYTTKRLSRNKNYTILKIDFSELVREICERNGKEVPIKAVLIENDKGEMIWVSTSEQNKIKDIKIHRNDILGDILDSNE
jgi:hypothetical protein